MPAPLKLMGDNYKLVILSNADDSFLDMSVPRLGADFHAVYTAEQAQAYNALPGLRVHARYPERQAGGLPARLQPHPVRHVRPMHDMGFRNLVLLDRGYDPITAGYDYTTVESLDELNKNLGL